MVEKNIVDIGIRNNPFWLEEVNQFAILKYELNPKNKDLYFWVLNVRHLDDELISEDDDLDTKERKLKMLEDEKVLDNQVLVRVVGTDYKEGGIKRRYLGGALFYELKDKKWGLVARLNVLKYAQDKNKPERRFRLSKPVSKVGMFDEVVGESPWDNPANDFKPGLSVYHEEDYRDNKEYAGILGAVMLYSETRIIQNEAIRYPVTYLNTLMEISNDLLNVHSSDSRISIEFVPKQGSAEK